MEAQTRQARREQRRAQEVERPRRRLAGKLLIPALAVGLLAAGTGGYLLLGSAPAARDGGLELTATDVRCGLSKVGRDGSFRSPGGQYCTVTVEVRNHAGEPRRLLDFEQLAFDDAGKSYRPDLVAGQLAEPAGEHQRFLSPIQPGKEVTGRLVYDLPPGAKLTRIMVHESATSAGAALSLS
ncbi:DUF4352 domain-containing protein [Longispora albida]|uniref:DUF4352 domain-containing protein n=1 Tax=Longispora albida TaxID=203523 RepID=UPI000382E9F1|nr:DUF4352 domain-containing protein [Longispora albida]